MNRDTVETHRYIHTETHTNTRNSVENLRLHYSKTLIQWYQQFSKNRQKIAKIYDERFCRMWEMYLVASEVAFRVGNITVLQIQLSRETVALPITRDYILEAEQELAFKDSMVNSIRPMKKARKATEVEPEEI